MVCLKAELCEKPLILASLVAVLEFLLDQRDSLLLFLGLFNGFLIYHGLFEINVNGTTKK